MFIRKTTSDAVGPKKWERDLGTNDINWDDIFLRSMDIWNDHKLKEFFYKLIHRIVATKKELCLHGIEADDNCFYCSEPNSIFHTFVECHFSTEIFFSQVLDYQQS